jgi:hypothetical protein
VPPFDLELVGLKHRDPKQVIGVDTDQARDLVVQGSRDVAHAPGENERLIELDLGLSPRSFDLLLALAEAAVTGSTPVGLAQLKARFYGKGPAGYLIYVEELTDGHSRHA